MDKARRIPWREYLLPIKGWRYILRHATLILFLPFPFLLLIGVTPFLALIPILLWWAMGVIWLDYWEKF